MYGLNQSLVRYMFSSFFIYENFVILYDKIDTAIRINTFLKKNA